MLKFAVISSSRASSFQAIYREVRSLLNIKWQLAVSDNENAGILSYALENAVIAEHLTHQHKTRQQYGQQLQTLMAQHRIDFILLVGFMRILSADFVNYWQGNIVNIHPSLLPKHQGLMDTAVHQAVLRNGEKKTGCSLHLVTADVDEGPVIMQKTCLVEKHDTVDALKQKVQGLEAQCLLSYIQHKANYEKAATPSDF